MRFRFLSSRAQRQVPIIIRVIVLAGLFLVTQLALAQPRKSRATPKPAPPSTELSADPAFHSVFRNARVQVWRLELARGASTQLDHRPLDYLILAVTPADLEMAAGTTPGHHLEMQPEQMEVMKGGWPHQTTNRGSETAVVIEIEPARPLDPEHAICGLSARPCRNGEIGDVLGQYTESVLFETGTAVLTRTELSAGAEIPSQEFKRDALLIAARPAQLRDHAGTEDSPIVDPGAQPPASSGNSNDRPLTLQPGDCAWFTAGIRHSLTNTGKQDAHFLMLEIK
jgi:hypothetical protein